VSLARQTSSLVRTPQVPPDVFRSFADRIRRRSGIVLGPEKLSLVQARLQRVASDKGFKDLAGYLRHVASCRDEAVVMDAVERLTTNHTYFWREKDHFELFQRQVVPEIRDQLARPGGARIWCAASSTGQEPWTLAGILQDVVPCTWPRHAIVATDLSSEVVEVARKGEYSAADVERLPAQYRSRWFRSQGKRYSVAPALRGEVDYRTLNLMDAAYPWRGSLHAVFCRNVLIYFDAPTRLAVVERIRRSLRPGGWLFLSQTEGLPRGAAGWERVGAGVSRKV